MRMSTPVAPTPTETSPVLPISVDAAAFEKPATATSVAEKPTIVSQNKGQPTKRQDDLIKGFNVFSATANAPAYRQLPELAQAYMQLGFELAQRLAQIKLPFEIASVFAEVATKQLAIVQSLVIPIESSR